MHSGIDEKPKPKSLQKIVIEDKSLPKITILRNAEPNPPFKTTQIINKKPYVMNFLVFRIFSMIFYDVDGNGHEIGMDIDGFVE
jgi:hypothetical protein